MSNATCQDPAKIIDKAGKLHALAVRGIDGEKVNAKRKLKGFVNEYPRILGTLYPDYLTKKNKSNLASNPPKEEIISKCIWHVTQIELFILTELNQNSKIACKILGYISAGRDTGWLSIDGTERNVNTLLSRYYDLKANFEVYFDNFLYAYLVKNGVADGIPAPNRHQPFYDKCMGAIDPYL